ncbi:MAG: HlyC/CorC family transporter [Anaerolineaceae bacterium]|nr:HlyC/CorC family transporter [Anaerolineaceae bacterium]
MILANILGILILVALNGFFVSVEFAAVASRRARLETLSGADSRAGQIVRGWLGNTAARDRLIAATQLGITLVSLALGAVGENTFEALLSPWFEHIAIPENLLFLKKLIALLPLVISLTVVTAIHVVLGEQVPKVAVLRSPERFALASSGAMAVFTAVFKGFINLLDWATRTTLSLVGIRDSGSHLHTISVQEFREMVSGPEMEGVIQQPEREMLSAVIDFGELVVRQISLPRTEIIAVEADQSLDTALEVMMQNGLSKLPVFEDSLDHVIGILYLRDLVKALQTQQINSRYARELAREALYVPETISVNHLLREFRARRMHIAIVLDEFGGTYGLVTLEDLLEEIVGEVDDTFEVTPPTIQPLADGAALIDGMAVLQDVNEYFGIHLTTEYYDSIAGYILNRLGHIPQAGEELQDAENGILLKVEKMDRLRIAQILLRRQG